MFGFRMPTRVHIQPGCVDRLPESVRALGMGRVLLVVDPGLQETPWPGKVEQNLNRMGIHAELFDEVESNPRTTTATAATKLLREEKLDGVVGLGGGSVLDVAKAAAMLAPNEGRIESFEGKNRYIEPPLPFVAVPTTCGTGSEVTWVSVLTVEATKAKISIKGETMFPNQALVDADLIATLPRDLVVWTGLDALTHALEATTCALANPVSDGLAEKAIELIFRFLPRAAADIEGDDEARREMMRASTLAGLAFGNADVAAVHCLSEALGGRFDVHHGLANAVLLLPVLRYHGELIEGRLAEIEALLDPTSRGAGASEGAARFLARLEGLLQEVELQSFASLDLPADQDADLAASAARNGSNRSNPEPMVAAQYEEILAGLR